MTLDDAIRHCYEVADRKCDDCGKEHLNLAKWLEELKENRKTINRQNAEIERLQEVKEINLNAIKTDLPWFVLHLKSEAIKKFAERLCKDRVSNDPVVIAVKTELKMTEGSNG